MFCEECKTRPATFHFTQMFNGQQVEMHLCQECAAKKGLMAFNLGDVISLPKLIGSFFGYTPVPGQQSPVVLTGTCPNCGTGFDSISQHGRLGCSECYTAFQEQLEPLLRRIHGNSKHTGKVPQRNAGKILTRRKIEQLKSQLQNAVAQENYELAAELRDNIKKLEREFEMG